MCSWKDGKFNGNFLDNARWKPLCPATSVSILHTEFPNKWLWISIDLFCILHSAFSLKRKKKKKNNFIHALTYSFNPCQILYEFKVFEGKFQTENLLNFYRSLCSQNPQYSW
jgi:hypothetical protein